MANAGDPVLGHRAVPGSRQLNSLWEQILRDDPRSRVLLRPESLVAQIRDTRKLAIDWRLDLDDPSWIGDEDDNHTAFHRWNRSFESVCRRQGWIAPEDRAVVLVRAIKQSQLPASEAVNLLGFDEFSPGQLQLLHAHTDSGCPVHNLVMQPVANRAGLLRSKSNKAELEQMARWVRCHYENEPGSTIAVVVPDLHSRRDEIDRNLREILMPGSRSESAPPWNISMGAPLVRVPMIESAFDVLRLLDDRIEIQDIGRVLRSPWVQGGTSERNSRARLEKCLREKYPRQLKLSEVWYRAGEVGKYDSDHQELAEELRQPRAWNSPQMVKMTDILSRFRKDTHGSRRSSAWAEAIDTLLAKLGWPQGDGLDTLERSDNWQAFQAWQEALRELASLDATLPGQGREAVIGQLHQICREKVFQPRTPPARIQVLGLYEASGLCFDHLWVMGLHNDNWPGPAQPNPFIPGPLQQKAQLPNSSPQRELKVAETVTRRLLASAEECIFSYPEQLVGEEVLPSPLLELENIDELSQAPGWQGDGWQATVHRADKPMLEPLLMPGPLQRDTARGGSSILKHQALCPFRAFSSNRLGADGLETPVDGISPMLHGSLMHRVLEYFWQETLNQEALLRLDDQGLRDRVQCIVDRVVNEERGLGYRPAFRQVEGDRLARLAMNCLELEKERDRFEVVGFEKEIHQEIEGQSIRLVIDRVDRLTSGAQVIIDYKTGRVDPSKWFGQRPEDPQLPLYAISAEATPAAIAFAVVRDDQCLYRGIANQSGILPGLPPTSGKQWKEILQAGESMPVTIENWRRVLHGLMAQFLSGQASIDPKNGLETCSNSYCELQSLCRIGELDQLRKGAAK